MTRLEAYGWQGAETQGVARVVRAHGDYYHLVANEREEGEIIARTKKSAFMRRSTRVQATNGASAVESVRRGGDVATRPMTGDFVRFSYSPVGDSSITEVLPRFSHFERRDANARRQVQTLAVNFNTLFIMMSLNANFSIPRILRFLDLAADCGEARVVVVVTKVDLKQDGDAARLAELRASVGDRAEVIEISALTGEGMDLVRDYAQPGQTLAFIGSSGVGKSTLLNELAGERVATTCAVQEWNDKGRHTTTARELYLLPNGALILDTPGIREIGRPGEVDVVVAKGHSTHRWRM